MDERSEQIAHRLEPALLVAAVLVVPVIVIDEAAPGGGWETLAAALNWLSWSLFVLEAIVMLSVVPSRRSWIRQHPLELAIVVLTPPFLTAFAPLRLLRLLALLRLVRLGPLIRGLFSMSGLRYAALLAALTAFIGGSLYASLEDDESTADGIYWAVTTMTTVGYGDAVPTTAATKVVAIVVMLVGIGFVAVLTGAVAQRFVAPEIEQEEEEIDALSAAILNELREIRSRLDSLEGRGA